MRSRNKMRRISHFSWLQYLLVLFIFSVLSVLPILMFGGIELITQTGGSYLLWFLLFWGAVALIFCIVTSWQKYQAFDRPMLLLGEAAGRVAQGDFSVYLKPLNSGRHQRYVDVMFEDFNRMVEELASLETMKKDFISNVSHEFRTPLAVMQNYATELRYAELPADVKNEYLDAIIASSGALSELVGNILRLNKIENQSIALNRSSYDLCRQLCDCVIGLDAKLEAKEIDFSAELEDERIIYGDEELLSLVWNNLLSNAVKFTEKGGSITIEERCSGDTVTVSVRDTGCGMDEDTRAHIFDKFYQGDTSHSKEGNGLGLALAKKVLELCGGTISVESRKGEGSVFSVTLPVGR